MTQRKERTTGLSRVWQAVRLLLDDGEWHSFERDILPKIGPVVPPERAVRRYLIQKRYTERRSGRVPVETQYEDMPAEDLSGRNDKERRRRTQVGTRAELHHIMQTYIKKFDGERRGQRGDMEYRLPARAEAAALVSIGTKRTLWELEVVIERGLNTFVEVGRALLEIRDGRKYREHGYKTFEVYCRERWQMKRPRAYQLIDAANVSGVLSTVVDKTPDNEWQARELVPILKEQGQEAVAAVWQEVQDEVQQEAAVSGHAPQITAAKIREVVQRHKAALESPQSEVGGAKGAVPDSPGGGNGTAAPRLEPTYDEVPCPHCGGTGTIHTPRTL